jgi:ABC-type transport system involved in multi-copper enzyme maturation permease subunit
VILGLLRKTLRETWKQTLMFGMALLIVEALLTAVLPTLQNGLNEFLGSLPFIRTFLQALLGSDLGGHVTAQMLQAIVWVHPVVLAIVWAQEIVFCTRVPAGEIDRGTIDVLLSWPASRRRVFLCEAALWLASGVFVLTMGCAGHCLAAFTARAEAQPPTSRVLLVLVNLYLVYISVGGLAYFISAMSDHRGRAMAGVFAVVLASFLLSFVAQIWRPAERLAPLGILSYYKPAQILATGSGPWGDMALLVAVGAFFWLAACETFARRNICTV